VRAVSACWRNEARPFLGDRFAFAAPDRLASLAHRDSDALHLDAAAERVLTSEAEHVTERWIGGVHITPPAPWRWTTCWKDSAQITGAHRAPRSAAAAVAAHRQAAHPVALRGDEIVSGCPCPAITLG
jgi:hypothetical protein